MRPCIVCVHDQSPFTFLSTPNNDFGENISDIGGGREDLSFCMTWYGLSNLEYVGIPDER
jgi:hypothetical protein